MKNTLFGVSSLVLAGAIGLSFLMTQYVDPAHKAQAWAVVVLIIVGSTLVEIAKKVPE